MQCDCQRVGQNNIHRSTKIIVKTTIKVVNNGACKKIDVNAKMTTTMNYTNNIASKVNSYCDVGNAYVLVDDDRKICVAEVQ